MTTKTWMRCLALLFAGTLALTGCSGDDGAQGPKGDKGDTGDKGDKGDKGDPGVPPVAMVEQCDGCHNGIAGEHAPRNQVAVSSVALPAGALADANLTLTVNVKVDGVNRNDFTHINGAYYWLYDAVAGYGTRTSLDVVTETSGTVTPAVVTVTPAFNGNYAVTLIGYGPAGATPAAAGSTFMVRLDNGNSQPGATVIAHVGNTPTYSVVGNQVCFNCHGSFVFSSQSSLGIPNGHHGANPIGYEGCMVCHDRSNAETRLGAGGTQLMGYVHGAHNSHNMPAATLTASLDPDGSGPLPAQPFTVEKPAGTYARNGSIRLVTGSSPLVAEVSSPFSFGFPGYMNNCSTCHDTDARLAIVNASKVSWALCMSCHDNWDGFSKTAVGGAMASHRSYTLASQATTTCASCHDGMTKNTVAAMHNGLVTERNGLLWDGADQSVVLGKQVAMTVASVAISGTTMTVTWSATQNGTAVNPCNVDFASGPVFLGQTANAATGLSASNMNLLRAYAIGNDWVNPGQGASPGQPNNTNLTIAPATTPNTTCAANVATSVLTLPAGEPPAGATKGTVSLQGKPQVRFAAAVATAPAREFIQVRSPSPTREFVVATGAAPASMRRSIVDVAKCEACHKGSIYQHGGNRVDSVDLCVTCHNPASNEKNNRVGMGVDATKAYDGQVGQTYDLRTMVHAIHSAGETGKPLVYYRSNGVYFFGNDLSLAPNWPTTGGVSCKNAEGSTVSYFKVFGSTATGTVPEANVDGTCKTTGLANSTDGTWRIHNQISVHYPRPLNDCSACHVDGAVDEMPNPTMAVAVTMEDAGAAPWNDLADDVLMGPSAASCMTCHQSADPVEQFIFRTHAYGNGWTPSAFVGGRQALIDAVTP